MLDTIVPFNKRTHIGRSRPRSQVTPKHVCKHTCSLMHSLRPTQINAAELNSSSGIVFKVWITYSD